MLRPGTSCSERDQTDLSANWGWIPLIDFALALREIAEALAVEEGSEIFEFTESEATLKFKRQGHEVAISGSYAPGNSYEPIACIQGTGKRIGPAVGRGATGEASGAGEEPGLSSVQTFRQMSVR